MEDETLCITAGKVCPFSACSCQSEQFFHLLAVSCQHRLPCCAFLFPDVSEMDVQTFFGSFPALPLPAAARTFLCSASASLVLTSLNALWGLLSFNCAYIREVCFLEVIWSTFSLNLLEFAIRVVYSFWSHGKNGGWLWKLFSCFLHSSFEGKRSQNHRSDFSQTVALPLLMVFFCCSCSMQIGKIQIFKCLLQLYLQCSLRVSTVLRSVHFFLQMSSRTYFDLSWSGTIFNNTTSFLLIWRGVPGNVMWYLGLLPMEKMITGIAGFGLVAHVD